MNKTELFDGIETLNAYLLEHRKSGTLTFRNADDKLIIGKIYKEIYPHVITDLNCVHCLLSYLNNLEAYYEREYPKHLKTIQDSVLNPSVERAEPQDLHSDTDEDVKLKSATKKTKQKNR